MTVNLSNLKVGDTVHLDRGDSMVVPEHLLSDVYNVCFHGHSWGLDGRYNAHQPHPFDIVAVTPKPEPKRIRGWVNVYDEGRGCWRYDTKEEADRNAFGSRVACVYIDVAEGEGL